jgi:predicted MPP superfamily phosphohydrolase
MAVTAVWIITFVTRFFNFNIEPFILAVFFFTVAAIVTANGAWKTFRPQIKEITVKIPNLPAEWKGKKIVQLSDVHLGQVYRENFMRHVAQKVNSAEPEMVVITGDLFDGMDGDLHSPVKPLNLIRARQGIFFVTGNHETYLGLEKAFAALQNTKIKILEDEVVDVNGLKLIGISHPLRMETKDIAATLRQLSDAYVGHPNILLYHSPIQIDQIRKEGVNLELCGHTHKGQIFPLNLITRAIYHGYDYGLHKLGTYTLYVSNGVGTWGPSVRTGNTPEIVVITLK